MQRRVSLGASLPLASLYSVLSEDAQIQAAASRPLERRRRSRFHGEQLATPRVD